MLSWSLGHSYSLLGWLDPLTIQKKTGYWDDLFLRNLHRIKGADVFHISFPTVLFRAITPWQDVTVFLLSWVRRYLVIPDIERYKPHGGGGSFLKEFYNIFSVPKFRTMLVLLNCSISLVNYQLGRTRVVSFINHKFNPYISYNCFVPVCKVNKQALSSSI